MGNTINKGTIYNIVSIKHTKKSEKYITFWRPNNKGYTQIINECGFYAGYQDGYHNTEDAIPIEATTVDKIMTFEKFECVVSRYVVKNTPKNRRILGMPAK